MAKPVYAILKYPLQLLLILGTSLTPSLKPPWNPQDLHSIPMPQLTVYYATHCSRLLGYTEEQKRDP